MLTHLSLFSGIGGLDLAAEWAGFRTVGQCEWADFPICVLEKHWPDVPRWRDIRTLTKEDFHARTGLRTVDLVTGGFPCQPFSVAGKRRGKADDRYLWDEMLRVINEIRPTWVVGENVAGLTSMAQPDGESRVESRQIARHPEADYYEAVLSRQEKLLLSGILEDLCNIGYDVQTFVVPACGVGAAHQRYRIAIVANAIGTGFQARKPGIVDGVSGGWKNDPMQTTESGGHVANAQSARSRGVSIQPGRPQQAHSDVNRSSKAMAYADSPQWGAQREKRDRLEKQPHGLQKRPKSSDRPGSSREDLGNAPGERLQDRTAKAVWRSKPDKEFERSNRRPAQSCMGLSADGLSGWMAGREGGRWQSGPVGAWDTDWDSVPRIKAGVKDRVAMLTALGNAVVPQQFYPFFAALAAIMDGGSL